MTWKAVQEATCGERGLHEVGEGICDVLRFDNCQLSRPDARVVRVVAELWTVLRFLCAFLACFIFLNLILAVVYNERRAVWKPGRSRTPSTRHSRRETSVDRRAIEQAQSRHSTQVLGLDQGR